MATSENSIRFQAESPKGESPGQRPGLELAERQHKMRFSPGRDGGSLPSAIADGYSHQKTESPGRDDSEYGEICCRPSGTLESTEETSPVTVVTGIELSSLPGLNRICQIARERSGSKIKMNSTTKVSE